MLLRINNQLNLKSHTKGSKNSPTNYMFPRRLFVFRFSLILFKNNTKWRRKSKKRRKKWNSYSHKYTKIGLKRRKNSDLKEQKQRSFHLCTFCEHFIETAKQMSKVPYYDFQKRGTYQVFGFCIENKTSLFFKVFFLLPFHLGRMCAWRRNNYACASK